MTTLSSRSSFKFAQQPEEQSSPGRAKWARFKVLSRELSQVSVSTKDKGLETLWNLGWVFEWHLLLTVDQASLSPALAVKVIVCVRFPFFCALQHFSPSSFLFYGQFRLSSSQRVRHFACLFQPIWLLQPVHTDMAGGVLCSFLHFATAAGNPLGRRGREGRQVKKGQVLCRIPPEFKTPNVTNVLFLGPADAVAHALPVGPRSLFFEDTAILWQWSGALKGPANGDEALTGCAVFLFLSLLLVVLVL